MFFYSITFIVVYARMKSFVLLEISQQILPMAVSECHYVQKVVTFSSKFLKKLNPWVQSNKTSFLFLNLQLRSRLASTSNMFHSTFSEFRCSIRKDPYRQFEVSLMIKLSFFHFQPTNNLCLIIIR